MKKKLSLCVTTCMLVSSVPLAGMGAEIVDTVADDSLTISVVTVTARRPSAKISAALPVQMLYADNLRSLGVEDMADAVRRFAGVNVRDYGGIGGLKTVSVRNMGASHTAVSYDGVPVSNSQAGQIDISRFSLDNVSQISLAVGHDNDLLQPARLFASAAVLNITTARPEFTVGKHPSFRIEVKGGSFGYISPSLRWGQKLSDKVALSLDGSFMRADGNYPFRLVNGNFVTDEKRYNSAVRSWHGEANLYYTSDDESRLNVKAYYYYSRRGLPGAVTLYNPISTEILWDKTGFFQTTYSKTFSQKWRLRASAKYNQGRNLDREMGMQFTGGVYSERHRQDEVFATVAAQYTPVHGLNIALSQDAFYNTLTSTLSHCPNPNRTTLLTALNAKYAVGIATFNVGAVGTYITESVESGTAPSDLKRINPSVAFSLHPIQNCDLYVRGFYKSTFRTPSFNDLYYDRMGNRSLRPERASEFDLGLTWSGALFSAMDYLTFTVDGYINHVRDKIVAFPTTYAWRMANYGKVRITGVDLTMATAVSVGPKVTLTLTAAFTYQKAIDLTDPAEKNYRHQLPYTPRSSGNIGLTVAMPCLTVGYSLVGVGERYFMSENIPANRIAGYCDQTITLSREFQLGALTLGLRGEIVNLFNEQYEIIKYYPMPGRSWRFGVTLKF